MTDPINKTGCVALYAARISFYANELVKDHAFNGKTGSDNEPWELAFQHKAARVYLENLPVDYLKTLAGVFLGCAHTMVAEPPPPEDLVEDWTIVHAYFANGSQAIADVLGISVEPQWEDPIDKSPTAPASVRFDVLATLVTSTAAVRLANAGQAVASKLESGREDGLDSEQLLILGALVEGQPLVEIATQLALAERTLYRKLRKLYTAMGVANRLQAVALASQKGWLP